MKKFYTPLLWAFLFTATVSTAQQTQWLNATPVNYTLNPEMPHQPACLAGNRIYAARMVDFALNYGIEIYSSVAIDCYDTSGALLWSYPVGPKLAVADITGDASGNVYVSGSYMETLLMNSADSLVNTGTGFNINYVLFSLDNTGSLRWKRNVTLSQPDAFGIPALAVDQQNSCWYGLEYFDSTTVIKLDNNGNDMLSHSIVGTRTLGSFSFDASGNLFIAGSAGFQTLTVNGFTVNVYEPYMMFLARINASGNTSWIKLAHDQTFQRPEVVATAAGDAFLSANLMDSTTWGNVFFQGPQWVYDIFLTKTDSAGNFAWGAEVPATPNILGDFQCGRNNFIQSDIAGNVYLTGTVRGTVDWGNGVVSDAGAIPSNGIAIICFGNNGVARWQKTGSATGFVAPYSVCAGNPDECYFSASAVGDVSFDSLTANQGGDYAFVLGKISGSFTAGIVAAPVKVLGCFPNPADKKLAISCSPSVAKGLPKVRQYAINSVSIFNVMGENVLNLITDESSYGRDYFQIDIDVSDFPSGIYFLQTGSARTKFIVQHE